MIERISINRKELKKARGELIPCCYGQIMGLVRSLDLYYTFDFRPGDGSSVMFDHLFDPKSGAARVLARCKSEKFLRMTVNFRAPRENALIADIAIVDAKKNHIFILQVESADGNVVQGIDSRY